MAQRISISTLDDLKPIGEGDLCMIYETPDGKAIVKVAKSAENNDLIENETRILSKGMKPGYIPVLHTSGKLEGLSYNVIEKAIGIVGDELEETDPYVTLADIIEKYPNGIDFRDMAWMWKRSLAGIGYAHRAGIIHGNVIPTHIMVHPTEHGGKLIDWCYAVDINPPEVKEVSIWDKLMDERPTTGLYTTYVPALTPLYADYYPSEILEKRAPTPSTDLYMLAKCIVKLLGGNVMVNTVPTSVPRKIRDLLDRHFDYSQSRRPNDAWLVHDELDAILLQEVGKPTYRPFNMKP